MLRVWEDKTEQTIKTFSFEGAPSQAAQKQYIVFFFDDTSMGSADQALGRQAAAKFVAANFDPNRMMAVVDFGATLKMTQNFTADPELLSKALQGVKQDLSAYPKDGTPANGPGRGAGPTGGPFHDERSVGMLAEIRSLAKNLSSLPGRKALILFTAGLVLSEEHMSHLNATVDACNMVNVTVYTVDVKGVRGAQALLEHSAGPLAGLRRTLLAPVSFLSESIGSAALPASFATSFMPQGRGGPGGGAPSGAGGSRGGAPGGGTSAPGNPGRGSPGTSGTGRGPASPPPPSNPNPNPTNPANPNPSLNRRPMPKGQPLPSDTGLARLLVSGTGGLEVRNTNDLVAGLKQSARNRTSIICLVILCRRTRKAVTNCASRVNRKAGSRYEPRPQYCIAKQHDLLSGTANGKTLESRAAGAQPGNIGASMQIPYFYTSSNLARVNVAMEIPSDALKFQKQKGKLHRGCRPFGNRHHGRWHGRRAFQRHHEI